MRLSTERYKMAALMIKKYGSPELRMPRRIPPTWDRSLIMLNMSAQGSTYAAIGAEVNLTPERVRQVLIKAYYIIKDPALSDYDKKFMLELL